MSLKFAALPSLLVSGEEKCGIYDAFRSAIRQDQKLTSSHSVTMPPHSPHHVSNDHRCFACHRPILYHILSYSQRYAHALTLLAIVSTHPRVRLFKIQTPLLWWAAAWSYLSRYALVGGYIWYALKDDTQENDQNEERPQPEADDQQHDQQQPQDPAAGPDGVSDGQANQSATQGEDGTFSNEADREAEGSRAELLSSES